MGETEILGRTITEMLIPPEGKRTMLSLLAFPFDTPVTRKASGKPAIATTQSAVTSRVTLPRKSITEATIGPKKAQVGPV
jgi:hypothetical protein